MTESMEVCTGCGRGCLLSAPLCDFGYKLAAESTAQGEKNEGRMAQHGGEDRAVRGQHGGFSRKGVRSGRGEHGDYGERGPRGGRKARGGYVGKEGRYAREAYGDAHGGKGAYGGHGRHGRMTAAEPSGKNAAANEQLLVQRFYHCAHLLINRRGEEGKRAGILMMLRRHGSLTLNDLADRLGIRPASANELLSEMEDANLLARSLDSAGDHAITVELTEQGHAEAGIIAEQRAEADKNLFAVLTEEEKSTLEGIIGKLVHAWHEDFAAKEKPASE